MSSLQHIGQDFSKTIRLSLLPGIPLKMGAYQWAVQFITETTGIMTMHHITMQGIGSDMECIFGRDVTSIEVLVQPLHPIKTDRSFYRYSMRLDRLILLNLAVKLLK